MNNKMNNKQIARSESFRILAQNALMENDTWRTGLNNNDLIIGPSGAGKTRSYVKPNLMQCNESFIVSDTKGSLIQEVGPLLRRNGYRVLNIDLTDPEHSCGYNPLDFIRYDHKNECYLEKDIMSVAHMIIPVQCTKDPFWEQSAQMYIACMIGYVLECLPPEEHSLEYVRRLFEELRTSQEGEVTVFDQLLQELEAENPNSFAVLKYRMFDTARTVKNTFECIRMFIAEHLSSFTGKDMEHMYRRSERIDFRTLGREKTAVFLTVSDTDRSMDAMASLLYTQALQALCNSADKDYPDHRLPVPVRLILDDFATNVVIPDFDKTISVIRSREIYVSVILQSLSQLNGIYGRDRAMTIVNNCDNCLYLGGQDVDTARYIALKVNKTEDSILNLPLGEAYLFTRGSLPRKVRKFDVRTHQRYHELPEASMETGGFEAGAEPDVLHSRAGPGAR